MVGKKSDEQFLLEELTVQKIATIADIAKDIGWDYWRTLDTMMRLQLKRKVSNVNGRGTRNRPGKYQIVEPEECPLCHRTDSHIHAIE